MTTYYSTAEHYSPHDLLPAPLPSDAKYPTRYFYNNVAKHLIKDFVKIMSNGIHIDLEKVEELETVLASQLVNVDNSLKNNRLIKQFQEIQHKNAIDKYIAEQQTKIKPIEHFVKWFNYKNMVHRSYFMYIYANNQGISQPSTILEGTTIPKWEAKLVKKLTVSNPFLSKFLQGEISENHPIAREAMQLLAEHKAEIYNKKYYDSMVTPEVVVPPFNPASPQQKQMLFEWLGIESEATSKDTGLPSWDRDQIDILNKQLLVLKDK
jgi:hypothetical protein